MAGVSVGFAKCFILFMAVVVLLQGVIYLGLAIWGITLRNCQTATDITQEPFKFAMDLIYFVEEDCGDPELLLQGTTYALGMDWSESYKVTHREYIFMITYAAVSGLWVVTSLLIITTLCSATTKVISGTVYWPWFLVILAGSILDVVATVYHSMDINKTLTLDDAFAFVGAQRPEGMGDLVWTQLQTFGVYFSTPAILLTCLSCRVVIIWLLNIFGGSFCLSLSRILANQTEADRQPKHLTVTASQASTRQQTPPLVVAQVTLQEQPSAPLQSPEYIEQYPEQIRPRPLPIIVPAHNAELMQRQESMQYRNSDRTTMQSPVVILPPPQQQQEQQQQQQDISTYRTTDAHPDRLNYPPTESSQQPYRAPSPAVQQLAVTSPLNNRYSEMYPAPQQNQRVSEELRNQMPWSYTSMVTKPQPPPPPRKPQQQVQIYPQIPEPDYAEH